MKKRVAVFLVFGVLICCGYAQAGWYKLTWGMTIDQIRAALTEEVVLIPKEKNQPADYYGIRNFAIGECPFDVGFFFDQKEKLNKVVLSMKGKDSYRCFLKLEDELTKKYGTPTLIKDDEDRRFHSAMHKREWMTEDTRIELNHVLMIIQGSAFDSLHLMYNSRLATEEKL